jgi:hypothetical protein
MRTTCTIGVLVGVIALMGCAGQDALSMDPKPLKLSGETAVSQEPFVAMVDNAAQEDLSLADIHFVPQTAELNSLGLQRLSKCAVTLARYGGTLRYDPQTKDRALIDGRLVTLEHALADAGMDMTKVSVAVGMAAQVGRSGADAVRAGKAASGMSTMPSGGGK